MESSKFTIQKDTYLEVQPEMPKTNALGCCSCVYLLCSPDFESVQKPAFFCQLQIVQQEFGNSWFSAEFVGLRGHPKLGTPVAHIRFIGCPSPPICVLIFSLPCLSVCLSGSLAGNSGRELSLLSYLSPSTRSPVSCTLQLIQEADKHR